MFIKILFFLIIIIVILGSSGDCSGLFNGGSAIASVACPVYGNGRVCRQKINNNQELLLTVQTRETENATEQEYIQI